MNCDPSRISCQLERIAEALSNSAPSAFEIWTLVVAIAGVLASTFVGVAALHLANRSNKQAREIHLRDLADAASARRRAFGAALDSWASSVLLSVGVGVPENEALLADQGDLTELLVLTDDDTAGLLLAWSLVQIHRLGLEDPDTKRTADHMLAMSQRIREWTQDPTVAAEKCQSEMAEYRSRT